MFIGSQPSEIDFLYNIVCACRDEGEKHDGIWQVAPVFCTIPFSVDAIERLSNLDAAIKCGLPELHGFARNRAHRAYHSATDTLTKPSYIGRLRDFDKTGAGCQLESIADIMTREPSSGGLVFSIFHPEDIVNRFRPGYVPCLVSGSFLIHDDKLHLNIFFRSQSVVEFGLQDLLFARRIQQEMFINATQMTGLTDLAIGSLNIFLARAIVQRRIARRRRKLAGGIRRHISIPREKLIPKWLSIVADHLPHRNKQIIPCDTATNRQR